MPTTTMARRATVAGQSTSRGTPRIRFESSHVLPRPTIAQEAPDSVGGCLTIRPSFPRPGASCALVYDDSSPSLLTVRIPPVLRMIPDHHLHVALVVHSHPPHLSC